LAISIVLGATVFMQQFVTLPLAVRAAGLSASAYGVIYAVNPVIIIAAQPFALRLLDRLPVVRTIAVSTFLIGLGFAMIAFATSVPVFALTVLVWTIGEIGTQAVTPALVAEIAPPHLRGRYNGMTGMAFGLSYLLAPLAGTWLFGVSRGALWIACLVAGTLSGGVALALGPAVARRQRALRSGADATLATVD
jgi:MFS family permease